MKNEIYFADLTHTAQGISAPTFPLGISYVVSYAKKQLGSSDFNYRLFKFPADLEKALILKEPVMLCLSNYSWNFELAYKMATLAKQRYPKLTVVFGGPNFPIVDGERFDYLSKRPTIDFYIQLEGEVGFVALTQALQKFNFDNQKLKASGEKIVNCSYVYDGQVVTGPVERIKDINAIPSPYLTGVLDGFFSMPLVPMFETTRGCPFSCSFCSDGIFIKSKINRYTDGRVRDELHYIAQRVSQCDEIVVTDLNFGMYPEDLETCRTIADIQQKHKWPLMVKGSAGKNKQERIIEAAKILKGSWVIGGAVQSTDPEVLKAIKRSNISSEAYRQFIEYGNSLGKESQTYSEVILGLPADTRQKHYESIRFGVNHQVNSLRMYQAMLLCGTEMSTLAAREQYGLVTKYRTIPGCVGIYDFFGEKHPVAEIEEIIVGSKSMPFEDYIECRVMNLIIETFYNNALFEEVFNVLRTIDVSVFDCLVYIKEHSELYSSRVIKIIEDFVFQTSKDLYDTFDQAKSHVLTPAIIEKYVGGELGINELLVHKALLFSEFEDISNLLFIAVKAHLDEKSLLTPSMSQYLDELRRFISHRKKNAITDVSQEIEDEFEYDFGKIHEMEYKVDPNQLKKTGDQHYKYRFFHNEDQKKHILNQLNLHLNTPIGLGRLIQRSNLKLMYRNFA